MFPGDYVHPSHIVIGAMHLHDCPQQPYIPIYLIVLGVFALLIQVLSVLTLATGSRSHFAALSCFFLLFNVCWFIAGNVWIYSIYEPSYNKTLTDVETYCDKTLYLFAFWTTNLVYIMLGVIFLSSCCVALQ